MNFSKLFHSPVGINLNAGTVSATPLSILEKITSYQNAFETNPPANWLTIWPKLWNAQQKVASFFKADPDDIFLRTNVTVACNEFILGVELGPGELVSTNLEYGAIHNILRLRAQNERRELRTIPLITQFKTEDEILQTVLSGLTDKTRLLLVSHVTTASGLIMPIQRIAQETRKRGIVLVVDGAHGPGSVPLDFSQLQDVDFYGGNLHKWMMGPKGTGFGWVPKWRQPTVHNIQAGWTTFEDIPYFDQFGNGSVFARRMLQAYSFNFSSYLALADLIDFWNEVGEEKILQRQNELKLFTRQMVESKLKFKPVHSPNPNLSANLSTYELPVKLQESEAVSILNIYEKTQVTINLPSINGTKHLRFSPGIWVNEKEIEEGISKLYNFFQNYGAER